MVYVAYVLLKSDFNAEVLVSFGIEILVQMITLSVGFNLRILIGDFVTITRFHTVASMSLSETSLKLSSLSMEYYQSY